MTEYQLLVVICAADVCSSILLFVEYFWGRSDTDMKSEAKRKRKFREKYRWEHLTDGEGR
jgi:hypothetical protein